MAKLYKFFMLFVGLIALNISVQAQLGAVASALPTSGENFLAMNAGTGELPVQLTASTDWAGLTPLFWGKDVVNFTNYPNPAISSTTIAYTLTAKAMVNLRVIDLTGKQLAVLVKQEQAAGKQEFYWELAKNNITSGMYILILQADNKIYSRKIIVQ
ncbi:MAG: T9SS type A sorting domain-containing protein [Pedobacter sp.]|nr:T9SS type A sorting domain-containing protein [Pedobacter sp.]MDQ8054021.1 T9SS type A sorting domain-containing protein [Pedobacter sp.]